MRFILSLLLILSVQSLTFAGTIQEITGSTMGTTYSVKWVETAESPISPVKLQKLVDDRLIRINERMSTYDLHSELSRFNASASTDWFNVSHETAQVAIRALEIAKLSGGAFDPTVGRLVGMWSFGADHREYTPPPEEKIKEALKSVGYQFVDARMDPPALCKSNPDVQLDFSAIAKGFGVDAISELLMDRGLTNSLVEIGGEVRTRGTKGDDPWTLGIERPSELRHTLSATIELHDQSLATSGDYRNFFEKDGVRYSHTINPHTGYPVNHQLASASIVAEDCMNADAYATTLMVLGPEKGLAFADAHHLAAYFIVREGDGYRELSSQAAGELFHTRSTVNANNAKDSSMNLLSTFLITAVVFGVALIGLAVGVIFSNRRIQGSCGGMSAMKDEDGRSICEMCTTPPEECDRLREKIVESCPKEEHQ